MCVYLCVRILCICIYVCVLYIYIYVFVYIFCVCVCVRVFVSIFLYMFACVYICVYAPVFVCIYLLDELPEAGLGGAMLWHWNMLTATDPSGDVGCVLPGGNAGGLGSVERHAQLHSYASRLQFCLLTSGALAQNKHMRCFDVWCFKKKEAKFGLNCFKTLSKRSQFWLGRSRFHEEEKLGSIKE